MLKTPNFNLLIAGFILYGLVAWFSAGYHHPDEHFQLLEPANYKLGRTPAADLPWEFQERIRPGLQIGVAYTAIKGMQALGIESPFQQAFVLRLASGWLMWLVIWAWAKQLAPTFGDRQGPKNLLWTTLLLWFMPYLSVRFSSENWAALAFLSGLLLITQFIEKEKFRVGWRPLVAGLLLGLSFFFRFQMAFALLGLAAWLLVYRKLRGPAWAWLLLGGSLGLGLGVCADFWLYGEWVPTALNYFQANIVEHKATNWGTAPWWYYFREMLLTGLPPISLLGLILVVWGGWKHRQHVFVWVVLPFFLAHTLVAHKELRFLFPLVFPGIVLAVLAWQTAWQQFGQRGWAKVCRWLALTVNFLALPLRSLTPANEALPCFRFLYEYAREQPITLLAIEKNPYELAGLQAHFYQPAGLQVQVLSSLKQLDSLPGLQSGLLIYPKLQLPKIPMSIRLERRYSYFPAWILALNVNDWQSRSRIWSIYEVKK